MIGNPDAVLPDSIGFRLEFRFLQQLLAKIEVLLRHTHPCEPPAL
ncbi:hypothetical protein [Mesorhizobium sp. M1B.F.Ca.ET.045.04.1.1]|nr:hypothetical protein [Mesorhizobium sp. M1B.F.Ca.ET.045.04.1.1]